MTNGDLQSLGELLQTAREEQALSLQEVEAQTRIRAKFLEALEEGDISVLPSTTHARGFLRNYAQFLRLDVNEVVTRFAEATGTTPTGITQVTAPAWTPEPAPPEEPVEADTGEVSAEREEAPDEPPPPVSVVAAPPIAHSTYVAPGQRSGPGRPAGYTPAASQAPGTRPPLPSPTAEPVEPPRRERGRVARLIRSPWFSLAILLIGAAVITTWAVSRLSQLSASQEAVATPIAAETATPDTFDPLAASGLGQTPTSEATNGSLLITDRVVLDIAVDQRNWLVIETDGEQVFEGQVEPGELLHYEAEERIDLRAGNGAGLVVTYNGQDIGALGGRGEVVERSFTVAGVEQPTPTATPTATHTPVPSPTPQGGG